MEKHAGDRRVKRTHQMLRDALFALIEERGYDQLTIQDITERATVGRATFYVYYRDKEQLLLESVNALMEDLNRQLQTLSVHELLARRQTFGLIFFRHAFEHAALYRVLLSERSAAVVTVRLQANMAAHMQHEVTEQMVALADVALSAEMLAEYCAAVLWSLAGWWVRNQFPLSVEEMGQIYWQLINQGMIGTLHLSDLGQEAHPLCAGESDEARSRRSLSPGG